MTILAAALYLTPWTIAALMWLHTERNTHA